MTITIKCRQMGCEADSRVCSGYSDSPQSDIFYLRDISEADSMRQHVAAHLAEGPWRWRVEVDEDASFQHCSHLRGGAKNCLRLVDFISIWRR